MKFFSALLLAFLLTFPEISFAKDKVYYAGLSFIGNHADNQKSYPYSYRLAEAKNEKGIPVLEQLLVDRVKQVQRSDLDFIINDLGNYQSGDSVSIALAIDWENVATEQIGGLYKLVLDIHAQVLIFDYGKQKVVGSYPIAVQIRDVSQNQPTDEKIEGLFKTLFYGNDKNVNILDVFSARIQTVSIKKSYGQYLRVTGVNIDDKARPFFPDDGLDFERSFSGLLAQSFGKFLSTNQGVSMLPYSKGEALGNKMAMRFANGDIFNLEIPSTDFGINLTLRGFKKGSVGKTNSKEAFAYGSYMRIKLEQPDFGKVYFDKPIRNVAVKEVPITQTEVDDWAAFQESLFALFDKFSKEINDTDKKWAQKTTGSKKNDVKLVLKEFDQFKKILDKCR